MYAYAYMLHGAHYLYVKMRPDTRHTVYVLRAVFFVVFFCIAILTVMVFVFSMINAFTADGMRFAMDEDDEDDHVHVQSRHHALVVQPVVPGSAAFALLHDTRHDHAHSVQYNTPNATRKTRYTARALRINIDTLGERRLSHDTIYMGKRLAHNSADVLLHGYAFLHMPHAMNAQTPATEHRDVQIDAHFDKQRLQRKRRAIVVAKNSALDAHMSAEKFATTTNIECAEPVSLGTHLKRSRGYYVHLDHAPRAMSNDDVVRSIDAGADAWRCAFRQRLNIEPLGPVLGVLVNHSADIDYNAPSGENHVAFARIHDSSAAASDTLAVTVTWGVFDGPVDARYVSEFTMIFNTAYTFGDCLNVAQCASNDIDLQSVATHEMGHALAGLDDLYDSSCIDATMYWSTPPRDTRKRTLTPDDVDGACVMFEAWLERKK